MSKRKLEPSSMASDDQEAGGRRVRTEGGDANSAIGRFKEKHSLDSDEEDNVEKYEIMDEDDIEGQEETTITHDGEIQITPFNMREELEEGHFDAHGMYIQDKTKEIQDSWIDNIDWVKVKEREQPGLGEDEDEESDEEPVAIDRIPLYRQMVELMKPNESVTKALRRLGGGKAGMASGSASQRWKKKKNGAGDDKKGESTRDTEGLLKLTGLADRLLQANDLEIYQCTFEKLNFLIKQEDDKKQKEKVSIPDGADDDDAMDMFADDFDKKQGDKKSEESKEKNDTDNKQDAEAQSEKSEKPESKESEKPGPSAAASSSVTDEVCWEYKWKNEESEEIHGPFTSTEMQEWVDSNFFADGVFCRKVGTTGDFYSSRRIDFDLYT